MKPNLPRPPINHKGFRVCMMEEADIDQALIDRYEYAEPETRIMPGYVLWTLYRHPTPEEAASDPW